MSLTWIARANSTVRLMHLGHMFEFASSEVYCFNYGAYIADDWRG